MSSPVPASTPPCPDSLRHTSSSPDAPNPVKKRSLSGAGSDPTRTEDVSQPDSGNGDVNVMVIGTGAAGPAKKRTKLTESEKEAREKERLERENERHAKEKERLAKRAERDEKKRIKNEERRKREYEQTKKEKAQMRLGSFFIKPTVGNKPQSTPSSTTNTSTQIVGDSPPPPPPPDVDLKRRERTDYERSFHPFFVKPNVIVAPVPFQRDDDYKLVIRNVLDNALFPPKDPPSSTADCESGSGQSTSGGAGKTRTGERMEELMHIPYHKRVPRGKPPKYSTKDILIRLNTPDSSSLLPLADLEGINPNKLPTIYLDLLNSLPFKFLRFAEDVRPPYSGTYTRKPASSGLLRGRNPFQKSLPKVDYEYDSEAEWGEDVLDCDGEELLSDEEDDEDCGSGDEDLEEFLDDEDEEGAASKNRRGVVSTLIPICSGLCWEDPMGKNPRKEFGEMSLGMLIDGVSGPIDPFSTSYWNPVAPPQLQSAQVVHNPIKAMSQFFQATGNRNPQSTMPPPGASVSTAQVVTGEPSKQPKPKQLIPAEDMAAFKRAIEGSDLTKAAMIEHLKKVFPQLNKQAIKNSLGQVAQRRGQTEKDKRWFLC
ncbi:unnamed protein product [Tuber aestivum]|uniref:Chromatin assembly factor 1 subunit A n=1 Tax=Tuber aestivum TaxID=59557 RepID=A0A292PJW8_9PEZI|nr:unnamed protein product [Tuber aestivum]